MFRAPDRAITEILELKRQLGGEHIPDEKLARLLRHIAKSLPAGSDVVGLAVDALLLTERPAWLVVIVGPHKKR